MTTTKVKQNIFQRITTAKGNFPPIIKNKVNPHFKNRYAGLEDIVTAIEPALIDSGVLITGSCDCSDNTTTLVKVSLVNIDDGDSITSTMPVSETNPQKQGSAITYARRYLLCLMLNLTTEDDDDGNAASLEKVKTTNGKQPVGVW